MAQVGTVLAPSFSTLLIIDIHFHSQTYISKSLILQYFKITGY